MRLLHRNNVHNGSGNETRGGSVSQGETIGCVGVVATKHPQVDDGIDFIDLVSDDRLKLNEDIKECDVQSKNESGD
jgi:hypothetical protein